MAFKKYTDLEMLNRLRLGEMLLPPLRIRGLKFNAQGESGRLDAMVQAEWPGDTQGCSFLVEARNRSTPQSLLLATSQVRAHARPGEQPLVMVPYLSAEKLSELEKEGVSGVDLCGNGVVVVPGRLLIMRTGQPNLYPDSRPLSNPYRGRSALVARALLERRHWSGLAELVNWMHRKGAELSLSQASKAVAALEEDLSIVRLGKAISLRDPSLLLDKLAGGWRRPLVESRQALRLPKGAASIVQLASGKGLKWAMKGETAAARYTVFSQGGPRRVAVSNLVAAMACLNGAAEPIPSFADVELVEADEPGYYFAPELDAQGVRWANRVQTWLELQAGDARQQAAATDIRRQILGGTS